MGAHAYHQKLNPEMVVVAYLRKLNSTKISHYKVVTVTATVHIHVVWLLK